MLKAMRVLIMALIVIGLVFFVAAAMEHLPEERGKALFNDPKFGGGTSGNSCNTCHPNGSGLEQTGGKKEFRIMGEAQKSLEEAVNFCIVNALKGKGINPASGEMKDIVSYIRSLK